MKTPKNFRFAATALASLLVWGGVNAQTIDFSSARGTGTATDKVLVENIRLQVPVTNPFNPSSTTTVETVYNVTFKFDYTTLHLVPMAITQTGGTGANNCATAQVQVYNAVQGVAAPLAGATITLGGQTVTTNSSGVASLSNLPSGPVSVGVVANGYVAASQSATLSCTSTNTVTVALSPSTGTGSLASGEFRVILTWGQNPDDLDSHLTGPAADGTRWHVYFSSKTGGDMCGLDVDDVSSYGPETITCPRTGSTSTTLRPGVYRYSVHHYAGTSNIGTSGANVRLEFGNGTVYNYTPPSNVSYTGSKDVWTVFELTVNSNGSVSVAPVNTISNSSTASGVRSATPNAGTFGAAESPAVFNDRSK